MPSRHWASSSSTSYGSPWSRSRSTRSTSVTSCGTIRSSAALFYSLYLVGVLVFVVLPALEAESLVHAAGLGALFGLIAYATFDLTCYALFQGFPTVVVAVDLVWGTVLTASVSAIGYGAGRWLGF